MSCHSNVLLFPFPRSPATRRSVTTACGVAATLLVKQKCEDAEEGKQRIGSSGREKSIKAFGSKSTPPSQNQSPWKVSAESYRKLSKKKSAQQTQTHNTRTHTCVSQVDDGEENGSRSHRDSQEEESLELLAGESVLQVLQEGVDLEQHKHAWATHNKPITCTAAVQHCALTCFTIEKGWKCNHFTFDLFILYLFQFIISAILFSIYSFNWNSSGYINGGVQTFGHYNSIAG